MIPLSNHDFQGSGELWGRDEINLDTWILWVIPHPAFTDPCRVHPPQKNRPQLRAARIPRSGRALPGPHSKPCSKVPEDERSWNRGISHMNAGDEHVCILYVYIYIYICMYVYIYMYVCMYVCVCCHLYFHCSRSRLYIVFISVEQVPDNIQKTYRPAKVWYVYI
jgi:hypothetical protein